jgi:tRNA pseudouridine55 synthase
MQQEKEYTGIFSLGATTPTYDLESVPSNFRSTENITVQEIHDVANTFIGEILQVPPIHSAIKKHGMRAYELARQGENIKLQARQIVIKDFDITNIQMPEVHFRVVCSTGTYIRSLANDFGNALGCGAYLESLCRTRIGKFLLTDALSMAEATELIQKKLTQNG